MNELFSISFWVLTSAVNSVRQLNLMVSFHAWQVWWEKKEERYPWTTGKAAPATQGQKGVQGRPARDPQRLPVPGKTAHQDYLGKVSGWHAVHWYMLFFFSSTFCLGRCCDSFRLLVYERPFVCFKLNYCGALLAGIVSNCKTFNERFLFFK